MGDPLLQRRTRFRRRAASGQAMVEAVLTLPLVVFLILGTLQLFLMLQARILTQYAAYRAVRAGSVNHGACVPMMHSALVSVLPTVAVTHNAQALATAFNSYKDNRHQQNGFNGQMVELVRESPTRADVQALAAGGDEDLRFDQPTNDPVTLQRRTLELRLVYWYYMKIPFANWMLSRLFQAHFALQNYAGYSPLSPTYPANWQGTGTEVLDPAGGSWPSGNLGAQMRAWSDAGHYVFPIQAHAAMRMMTPLRARHFSQAACSLNVTGP